MEGLVHHIPFPGPDIDSSLHQSELSSCRWRGAASSFLLPCPPVFSASSLPIRHVELPDFIHSLEKTVNVVTCLLYLPLEVVSDHTELSTLKAAHRMDSQFTKEAIICLLSAAVTSWISFSVLTHCCLITSVSALHLEIAPSAARISSSTALPSSVSACTRCSRFETLICCRTSFPSIQAVAEPLSSNCFLLSATNTYSVFSHLRQRVSLLLVSELRPLLLQGLSKSGEGRTHILACGIVVNEARTANAISKVVVIRVVFLRNDFILELRVTQRSCPIQPTDREEVSCAMSCAG